MMRDMTVAHHHNASTHHHQRIVAIEWQPPIIPNRQFVTVDFSESALKSIFAHNSASRDLPIATPKNRYFATLLQQFWVPARKSASKIQFPCQQIARTCSCFIRSS